ncbi:hypothetical protein ABZV58_22960 [Nocardia sp. NPDC004654]|uniref:hypothetical protein n=1 Tax=Nocardia sp. NPDC004654 TaxID=3154776 RepID=UPI0033BC9DBE
MFEGELVEGWVFQGVLGRGAVEGSMPWLAGVFGRWVGAASVAVFGVVPVGWPAFVGVGGVPGVPVSAEDGMGAAGFGAVPGRWVGWAVFAEVAGVLGVRVSAGD